jgi:Uma2 family endonuclease
MNQPFPERINLADFLTWESTQTDQTQRYEWADGTITPIGGVSDDHSAISLNLAALIRPAIAKGPCFIRGSDRKLIPKNAQGVALGSFYADLFVSCQAQDRKGPAAHYPTLVIEILSDHGGGEFTKKRDAYMLCAHIREYVIVDSTRQYAIRYFWNDRHFSVQEYYRGPIQLSSVDLSLAFHDIYADTKVPFVLHPVHSDEETISNE